MKTIGWLLILIGIFILMRVSKGRSYSEIIKDSGDFLRGALTGLTDYQESQKIMSEVLARTGHTNDDVTVNASNNTAAPSPDRSSIAPSGGEMNVTMENSASNKGLAVLNAAKQLAAGANYRYILGSQGPNAYDCSSLIWAAMRKTGMFNGARFTTFE